jgi:hypothetical protein
MRAVLKIISWFSLILLTAPSILFLAGAIDLPAVKRIMLLATLLWFASAIPSGKGAKPTKTKATKAV